MSINVTNNKYAPKYICHQRSQRQLKKKQQTHSMILCSVSHKPHPSWDCKEVSETLKKAAGAERSGISMQSHRLATCGGDWAGQRSTAPPLAQASSLGKSSVKGGDLQVCSSKDSMQTPTGAMTAGVPKIPHTSFRAGA